MLHASGDAAEFITDVSREHPCLEFGKVQLQAWLGSYVVAGRSLSQANTKVTIVC